MQRPPLLGLETLCPLLLPFWWAKVWGLRGCSTRGVWVKACHAPAGASAPGSWWPGGGQPLAPNSSAALMRVSAQQLDE